MLQFRSPKDKTPGYIEVKVSEGTGNDSTIGHCWWEAPGLRHERDFFEADMHPPHDAESWVQALAAQKRVIAIGMQANNGCVQFSKVQRRRFETISCQCRPRLIQYNNKSNWAPGASPSWGSRHPEVSVWPFCGKGDWRERFLLCREFHPVWPRVLPLQLKAQRPGKDLQIKKGQRIPSL